MRWIAIQRPLVANAIQRVERLPQSSAEQARGIWAEAGNEVARVEMIAKDKFICILAISAMLVDCAAIGLRNNTHYSADNSAETPPAERPRRLHKKSSHKAAVFVEVAITERNRHIALIFLWFQKSVSQLVSDLDQLTAITLLHTHPSPLYTKLSFQSFHGAFRYISEFCYLSDWIARSQKFQYFFVFFFLSLNGLTISHLTTKS